MTLITFEDGNVVMRDGKIGTEQACCCCVPTCGEDCQQTVTVNFSAGEFDGQIVFVVADEGFGFGFDEMPELYTLCGASIDCAVVDGCAQWAILFSVCYSDGVTTIAEVYQGFVEADSEGCPKTGSVTMNHIFDDEDGESTVTASIA